MQIHCSVKNTWCYYYSILFLITFVKKNPFCNTILNSIHIRQEYCCKWGNLFFVYPHETHITYLFDLPPSRRNIENNSAHTKTGFFVSNKNEKISLVLHRVTTVNICWCQYFDFNKNNFIRSISSLLVP